MKCKTKVGIEIGFFLLTFWMSGIFIATACAPEAITTNERWHMRHRRIAIVGFHKSERVRLAGLDVAVWMPKQRSAPSPLIIFSHGFRGGSRMSSFLTQDLAEAGYLVIAPTHKDSIRNGIAKKEESFSKIDQWSENTYADRENDVKELLIALHENSDWNSIIDWSKVALIGHSLGGYTVLGLAGAWPSWKIPQVKAVIALAPYTNPFLNKGTLGNISVPVMYQSGSRDFWIDSFIKGRSGAFSRTPPPAILVEFDHASHFAWTDFNNNKALQKLISYYCIEFLNKHLHGDANAAPDVQLQGVKILQTK